MKYVLCKCKYIYYILGFLSQFTIKLYIEVHYFGYHHLFTFFQCTFLFIIERLYDNTNIKYHVKSHLLSKAAAFCQLLNHFRSQYIHLLMDGLENEALVASLQV